MATARGAQASFNTTIQLSSCSTTTLEEVAENAPDSLKFFQIYLSTISTVNEDLWTRVRDAGYKGLVLTTDS